MKYKDIVIRDCIVHCRESGKRTIRKPLQKFYQKYILYNNTFMYLWVSCKYYLLQVGDRRDTAYTGHHDNGGLSGRGKPFIAILLVFL